MRAVERKLQDMEARMASQQQQRWHGLVQASQPLSIRHAPGLQEQHGPSWPMPYLAAAVPPPSSMVDSTVHARLIQLQREVEQVIEVALALQTRAQ
jgi:hypothetical protein